MRHTLPSGECTIRNRQTSSTPKSYVMLKYWTFIFHTHTLLLLTAGLEPATTRLKVVRSTNWATPAIYIPARSFFSALPLLVQCILHKTLLPELPLTKARFELAKHTHGILRPAPLTARELCLLRPTQYILSPPLYINFYKLVFVTGRKNTKHKTQIFL